MRAPRTERHERAAPTRVPRSRPRTTTIVAAGDAGDWDRWADLHTEDCEWVEHHYGTIVGRDAIRSTITASMAPVPMMQFPVEWYVIDGNRVVYFPWQVFPDPEGRRRRVPVRVHHRARVRGRRAVLAPGGRLQPDRGRGRRDALARRRRAARRRPRRARDRGVSATGTFRFGVHTSDAAPGTGLDRRGAPHRVARLLHAPAARPLRPPARADRGDDRGRGRDRHAARRLPRARQRLPAPGGAGQGARDDRPPVGRPGGGRPRRRMDGARLRAGRACRSIRPACACRGSRRRSTIVKALFAGGPVDRARRALPGHRPRALPDARCRTPPADHDRRRRTAHAAARGARGRHHRDQPGPQVERGVGGPEPPRRDRGGDRPQDRVDPRRRRRPLRRPRAVDRRAVRRSSPTTARAPRTRSRRRCRPTPRPTSAPRACSPARTCSSARSTRSATRSSSVATAGTSRTTSSTTTRSTPSRRSSRSSPGADRDPRSRRRQRHRRRRNRRAALGGPTSRSTATASPRSPSRATSARRTARSTPTAGT